MTFSTVSVRVFSMSSMKDEKHLSTASATKKGEANLIIDYSEVEKDISLLAR